MPCDPSRHPDSTRFPARGAGTVKLKQVSSHHETRLPGQSFLECSEVTIDEVHRGPAQGTDNVVVVTLRARHHVPSTPVGGVNTTHETVLPEDIQCPIDSHASDIRRERFCPFQNRIRSQAFVA